LLFSALERHQEEAGKTYESLHSSH
jgi:hypothetical protein